VIIAAGLPIGSGLIEAGHKHVLQARLRISGAAWLPSNGETMAQLRVLRSPMTAGPNSGRSPLELLDAK